MKIKLMGRRLFVCLTCLCMIGMLFSSKVYAREMIDTQKTGSLTVQYPCEGAEFHLYRVANVSKLGEYSLAGDFSNYEVSLDQPDQTGWKNLASTLESYVIRDSLTPLASDKVKADGQLKFHPLMPGMYLVFGEKHISEGYAYTPESFLISVPNINEADEWVYDLTAKVKYERQPENPDKEVADYKVLKVWDDKEDKNKKRPEKIVVQLLCDSKVVETVTLSKENNWRYIWTNLDTGHTWRVTEKDVPKGYKVTVTKEGTSFVITNKYVELPPDSEFPPKESDKSDESGGGSSSGSGSLPRTGQLWWPIPLLAFAGMILFVAGWTKRRKGERNE